MPWLLLALALFGVGAFLSLSDDSAASIKPRPVVEFRRYPDEQERKLMQERRTLPPLPSAPQEEWVEPERRDPLLVALPKSAGSAMVFEAGAFFTLPLGAMVLRCLEEEAAEARLSGFDPDKIDRVAFANPEKPLFMVSGKFTPEELALRTGGAPAQPYGDSGQIFRRQNDQGEASGPYMAQWNGQLLMMSDERGELEGAIDRLEGRSPGEPAIAADQAYGEAYGRLRGEGLKNFLPEEFQDKLDGARLEVDFHVDASEDALLMVDAQGEPNMVRDLGQALASALAVRRVQAVAEGDKHLAELLDQYAVRLHEQGFQLEAAFTVDFARRLLGACAQEPQAEPEDGEE